MDGTSNHYDVVIAGGGPSGSTAALTLARAGLRVAVVEKCPFPRFQIGESLLPANFQLMRELGLLERMDRVAHVPKYGAEFGMGGTDRTQLFHFETSLAGGARQTVNVLRSDFDAMLLDEARRAGAEVLQPVALKAILELEEGRVRVETSGGPLAARWLIDASGHAAVVGRHLGTRAALEAPELRKVAYFAHFEGVRRLEGELAGYPTIAMCDEGWFWLIPLDERTTSVGLVLDVDVARRIEAPASRMLDWGIGRCPLVRGRMAGATGPETNQVRADFSYRCRPCAGPGYFLVGDAASFLDPIFSTGVSLGMVSAHRAASLLIEAAAGRTTAQAAQQRYRRETDRTMQWMIRLIRHYYRHSFRELFLRGRGPLQMQRSVLTLLTGHAFPEPPWRVRWRFWLFERCLKMQERWSLAPHLERFSLRGAPPAAWRGAAGEQGAA